MKKNLILSSLVAISMIVFSGCASKMEAPQNSGFFENYKEFKNDSNVLENPAKLSRYKKVYVEDVVVLPAIANGEQTNEQKNLYIEISKYATARLKEALKFKNTDTKSKDTVILSSALSASEVHFDDNSWNQYSPLSLGITVVSLNAYLEDSARLVGEYRLDGDVTLAKSRNLIKDPSISLNGDFLTLEDLKKPIDAWVDIVASEINKGIK